MSVIPSPAVPSRSSQYLVVAVLPFTILGLFITALFFGFLGDQATEIAKLIREIEDSCTQRFTLTLLSIGDSAAQAARRVACEEYLPKILMFYALSALWCVTAFLMTADLTAPVDSRSGRFWSCVIVSISVPAVIMLKYFTAVPPSTYVRIVTEPAFSVSATSLPYFAAGEVVLIAACLLVMSWLFAWTNGLAGIGSVVRFLFGFSIAIFIGASLAFAYHDANLYDALGSINIIVLYVLLLYVFVAGLFHFGRVTGYPLPGLFLLYIIGINLLGPNHTAVAIDEETRPQRWQGAEQLQSWLKGRRDFDAYRTKKYPIYIIASSGGGMYAAMRSAYVLEALQRHCPAFLHHTFAISGVSGGALGALAFAAEQQTRTIDPSQPCNIAELFQKSDASVTTRSQLSTLDKFFERDVVSAIVGGGLFPDMLQRMLPVPIPIEGMNRARAFRKALIENWRQALPSGVRDRKVGNCTVGGYFADCNLNQYWRPDGDFPFMVFNATWVDVGAPVALSNLDPRYYARALAASAVTGSTAVQLLDGASLSARFPVALPAGVLANLGYTGPMRLVDGGYFDNSGLYMASAIKREIIQIIEGVPDLRDRIEVHLVYLGENYGSIPDILQYYNEVRYSDCKDGKCADQPAAPAASGLPELPATQQFLYPIYPETSFLDFGSWMPRGAELGAHAKALFRARDQRSLETIKLISRQEPDMLRIEWVPFDLVEPESDDCKGIPLAWYLAPCTRENLKVKLEASIVDAARGLLSVQAKLTPQ